MSTIRPSNISSFSRSENQSSNLIYNSSSSRTKTIKPENIKQKTVFNTYTQNSRKHNNYNLYIPTDIDNTYNTKLSYDKIHSTRNYPYKSDSLALRMPIINDLKKSFNNSLSKKNFNFRNRISKSEKMPLIYNKKYIDTVYDSKNLIFDYSHKMDMNFEPNEKISEFSKKIKESNLTNNLLILMNKESQKLSYKEKQINKESLFLKNKFENDLKEFENFKLEHKKLTKGIESSLISLTNKNKILFKELMNYKSSNKTLLDEIQKVLEQIDYLRLIALFINKSLQDNKSIYEKEIFPE